MLRHIVFFTCKDPADAQTVHDGLNLLAEIPDCRHFEVGRNLKTDIMTQAEPDFVVYGEFDGADQLARFKAHANYQRAIAVVRPLRDMRIAADFLTGAQAAAGSEPERIEADAA